MPLFTELNHAACTFFPKEYLSRKLNFQKASCAKWPLPSCRKLFRIFGGKTIFTSFPNYFALRFSCHSSYGNNADCYLSCSFFSPTLSFLGFQRQASPTGRRQFPHGGYRLDAFNFEDDSHGWRFDMDMVIIYIYSVNWVIGFIIFCFFCYFFFLSF